MVTGGNSSSLKATEELQYWTAVKEKEPVLHNSWYEYFYTTHFGLDSQFYSGKRILDIGCGPRGSLEWADLATMRVGLDPLADSYLALGANKHKMQYVAAPAEAIPFPDDYFDVVCSFNSLDHVDDLDAVLHEVSRVTAPGGLFLLLTDVNHRPTVCEPLVLSWDLVDRITPKLMLVNQRHFEKLAPGMYQSLKEAIPYNHADGAYRYGILSAKFRKPT